MPDECDYKLSKKLPKILQSRLPTHLLPPVDIPPIVIPNMDPAMGAMFAMMQQNQAAQLKAMREDMDKRNRQLSNLRMAWLIRNDEVCNDPT